MLVPSILLYAFKCLPSSLYIFIPFLQADMEEAKTKENAKLQSALQEVQFQFKEAKEILVKERETAKRAAEKIPIIQEVPVVDREMMNKLSAENENLKVGLLKLGSQVYTSCLC